MVQDMTDPEQAKDVSPDEVAAAPEPEDDFPEPDPDVESGESAVGEPDLPADEVNVDDIEQADDADKQAAALDKGAS